jgi:ribonuclease Y
MQRGIEKTRLQLKEELQRISGLTQEEARQKLMSEVDEDIKDYEAKKIRQAQKKVEEVADEKAKEILVESMQRIVTDYVGETTTSTIKVDDDKVKGRIIGKEGRNIRAFEKLTGVDVIIDESPNTIALSSFDPLRREIATVALNKLIGDGRIHPSSIEEAIRKAKNEISIEIKKNGEILAEEAGWPGIDIGLIKLLGKMKYRTSYGQSLMSHTIEVIRIGEVLAAELGADVDLVKKACLLHDIGKVLSHKIDSPHHHISGQIARKYGLDEKLVNAIEAHHLDIEPQSVEAVIVYLADAISGARPGARKDSYEQYIQRIEALENVAKEVGGDKIEEVFAIRAGRELRVIVKPNLISDDEMTVLAKDLAETIEKTQNYPGNVEVTLIRETRAVEIAK